MGWTTSSWGMVRPSPPMSRLGRISRKRRPLFGCVGDFNERIDYALLNEVALSLSRGALVLVGPLTALHPGPEEEERRRLFGPSESGRRRAAASCLVTPLVTDHGYSAHPYCQIGL